VSEAQPLLATKVITIMMLSAMGCAFWTPILAFGPSGTWNAVQTLSWEYGLFGLFSITPWSLSLSAQLWLCTTVSGRIPSQLPAAFPMVFQILMQPWACTSTWSAFMMLVPRFLTLMQVGQYVRHNQQATVTWMRSKVRDANPGLDVEGGSLPVEPKYVRHLIEM